MSNDLTPGIRDTIDDALTRAWTDATSNGKATEEIDKAAAWLVAQPAANFDISQRGGHCCEMSNWQPVLDTIGSILDDDLPLHYLVHPDGNMVYQGGGIWWKMPKGYAIFRSTKGEQQPAALLTPEQVAALRLIVGGEWDSDNRWWGIADEPDQEALALLRQMLKEIEEQAR